MVNILLIKKRRRVCNFTLLSKCKDNYFFHDLSNKLRKNFRINYFYNILPIH